MGLAAGLSPGPLLTLVITESLQHGIKAGIKIAVAPIIHDTPIVVLMLLIAGQLSGFDYVVGILSLIGSGYVLYIANATARLKEPTTQLTRPTTVSIYKGVLTNALSPHPYLFWFTIGAPTIIKSVSVSAAAPVAFIFGFYLPLVGSKVILAWMIGNYRTLLSGPVYKNIMRLLSLMLGVFAILLFIDGLKLIGFWIVT